MVNITEKIKEYELPWNRYMDDLVLMELSTGLRMRCAGHRVCCFIPTFYLSSTPLTCPAENKATGWFPEFLGKVHGELISYRISLGSIERVHSLQLQRFSCRLTS